MDIGKPGKKSLAAVPGVRMLASYRTAWLPKDLVAGLVLTALLVPQGMAYAELAGLPAITGLYTSILCLIGYAIFGPSRILVLGPDSALGPMIAATILPLIGANGDPERAVALASTLALLVGAIIVLGGVLRLGFIADLLSKPTMTGYMNGLAITILVGQLPKLFGFSTDANGFVAEVRAFATGVADGKTVPAALAIGVLSLVGDLGTATHRAEGPERAHRGGDVDRRGEPLSPRSARGEARGHAPAGVPAPHRPPRRSVRYCAVDRWSGLASPSSAWPTRSQHHLHLPSGPARSSTATKRWSGSAPPTSAPGSSKDSP